MNKKAALSIDSWLDYLLLFVIGLFGFIFLFTYLSFSLLARDKATIQAAESSSTAADLIIEQKWAYQNKQPVDINDLKSRVNYVNKYKLPPPKPVEPRSGRFATYTQQT